MKPTLLNYSGTSAEGNTYTWYSLAHFEDPYIRSVTVVTNVVPRGRGCKKFRARVLAICKNCDQMFFTYCVYVYDVQSKFKSRITT